MLYMRGSSTDDSFIRNRLTYKRAKRWERTGRKSQYFTLISWHSDMSLCASVCFVTPTARTSALCIIMDPVPTGELAVDCLWMLLQLPLPLSLLSQVPFHSSRDVWKKGTLLPCQSAFQCDGWDVALVGRGGCTHKAHVHYIYTKNTFYPRFLKWGWMIIPRLSKQRMIPKPASMVSFYSC